MSLAHAIRAITSPDEAYEAAGFVMDAILLNGAIDDPLGDSAALRPTDIVRDDHGNITHVLCAVRPCDADNALHQQEDRILVGV